MGYCGFTFGCGCGVWFDFYHGEEGRITYDNLFTMIPAVYPGGENDLEYTSEEVGRTALYARGDGQMRTSLTQHTSQQEFVFTVRSFEELTENAGRFEVAGVLVVPTTWTVVWQHLVPTIVTWSSPPSPGPAGLDFRPLDYDDVVTPDAFWSTRGIGLFVPLAIENNPSGFGWSSQFDMLQMVMSPQQTGYGFGHPFGENWLAATKYNDPDYSQSEVVLFGVLHESTNEIDVSGTNYWQVDTIVAVDESGFDAHIGSAAGPHWRDIEYPGVNTFNADCAALAAKVTAINEGEPIPRIVAVAPHSFPWVAAVVYPKIIFYAENRGCSDPDVHYTTVEMDERAQIIIGPLIFGDDTTPHRGPDGTGTDDIVIYDDTVTNDRLLLRGVPVDIDEPPWLHYEHVGVFPQCHLPSVLWFDRHPDTGDYGIIWSVATRTVSADPDIPREEITSEEVVVRVTINGVVVLTRQIYWEFDTNVATGMIAATVEPDQGFTNSAIIWLEKSFSVSPTPSEPGTPQGWILHVYDGDTEVWSLHAPEAVIFDPSLIQHSDRFFYVYNFFRKWEVDEGGDGESYYLHWVVSYQWDEDRSKPAVMYPFAFATEPGGHPTNRVSVIPAQLGVDSYKNTDLNALAPPFEVRRP